MITKSKRKFEIPYNFDLNLLTGIQLLNIPNDNIEFIYMMPHPDDYIGVNRERTDLIKNFSKEEYASHIQEIKKYYPGKLQLLLQKKDPKQIMPKEMLQWYIDLGFTAFCCATIEQAKMIKEINPNFIVIGSIVMHIDKQKLLNNKNYFLYFDYFVLDFSYTRDLQKIKILPIGFKYMILANSHCHHNCPGDYHWFEWDGSTPLPCRGLANQTGFKDTTMIRPMDLKYFDPYIDVFKIQDRAWQSWEILRDLVLYTSDYTIYPGITYDEDIYEQ